MGIYESYASREFWVSFSKLDRATKKASKKAYKLWIECPRHPSLSFKPVEKMKKKRDVVWAVRINSKYRALCDIKEGRIVTWFWIGDHDEYIKRFLS